MKLTRVCIQPSSIFHSTVRIKKIPGLDVSNSRNDPHTIFIDPGITLVSLCDAVNRNPRLFFASSYLCFCRSFFRNERVFTVTVAFTIVNVYIVQMINRIFLKPKLFSAVFGIPYKTAESWSETASGFTQSLLFSVSSYLFEVLANIEGSATSEGKSEQKALIYFWYFFFITRYMGQVMWGIVRRFWEGCKYALVLIKMITR